MDQNKPYRPVPVKTVGYQTSVNTLARQQQQQQRQTVPKFLTTTTTAIDQKPATTFAVGVKRARESIDDENGAFDDGAAIAPKAVSLRPKGFVHPATLLKPVNRFVASKIIDSTSVKSEPGPSEYTQRKTLQSTPGPSQNPLLSLSHPKYGLPPALVANFASLGVNSIYPWQASCLLGKGLLDGERNLIYTAPTGGGKSLVADVLMLKKVLEDASKKAILVVPYVALVQEKMKWLRRITEGITRVPENLATQSFGSDHSANAKRPLRVSGMYGGSTTRTSWKDMDIAVCTIEKANSLVNTCIEEGSIKDLGVVVIDELHMLDDEHRGYIMELMITKLMSLPQREEVQIVGMSATLSNTETIANWIDARYFASTYKPIPIEEYIVYDNLIYPSANAKEFFKIASRLCEGENRESIQDVKSEAIPLEPIRRIEPSIYSELCDPMLNALVALALETASAGYGALVFCSSRQGCHHLAKVLADATPLASDQTAIDKRSELVASLRSLPSGLDPVFEKTVAKGVAFHHAGLTVEERELVADAYDQGVLKIMVATCSLAAGINLPARRVILYGARMGREMVGPAMLRQMKGRAGRKGKDEIGEAYLLCQMRDLDEIQELLEADLPALESCLTTDRRGVKRALLESIATRLVTDRQSIDSYVRRTLLFRTADLPKLSADVRENIRDLIATELIRKTSDGFYEPTSLGSAIVAAGLTPEDGLFVHEELQRALQAFVMDGDMHVFYTFTPLTPLPMKDAQPASEIDWQIFRSEMDKLDESGIRALKLIGVKPAFVNTLVQSGASFHSLLPKGSSSSSSNLPRIYSRVYTSFQLRDICNELPYHTIAQKYNLPRGTVQNLATTSHGFASSMIKFSQRLGYSMLATVLEHMQDRLRAGARADLLEMAQVPFVKSRMARMLWEAGFRDLRALAHAEVGDLVPVLVQATPGKVGRLVGGELERYMGKVEGKARVIVEAAGRIWERQVQVSFEE